MRLCALCRQPRPLRESHIIPEACFKEVYDAKGRALPISTRDGALRIVQNGPKVRGLLCDECENRFSKREKVFVEILKGINKADSGLVIDEEDHFFVVHAAPSRDVGYAVLSILWRLSLCLTEQFPGYELGPYQEPLREALLAEDVEGQPFAIMVGRIEIDHNPCGGVVMGFPRLKVSGSFSIHQIVLCGFIFKIFVRRVDERDVHPCMFLHLGKVSQDWVVARRPVSDFEGPQSVLARLFDEDVEAKLRKMGR